MQTWKSQHYDQNRHKICEKQCNYYDKNVDLVTNELVLVTNKRKKIPAKTELNYLQN